MELGRPHVPLSGNGSEVDAVVGGGHNVAGIDGNGIVGVDEIDETALGHPFQQRIGPQQVQLIPTDVGNLHFRRQPLDSPWNAAEPGNRTELLAFAEEQLQTQAQSQQWSPVSRFLPEQFHQLPGAKIVHRIRKGSYPRQDQLAGSPDRLGVLTDLRRDLQAAKGVLHAVKIVDGVVNDGDHHRTPLVEGTPLTAGFLAAARESARPADLNMASAMWWEFFP